MSKTPPAPDDLPRSASGRIPKWVLDEAHGRPAETPGFRAYGTPDPLTSSSKSSGRRGRSWLGALLVVGFLAVLVAGAHYAGIDPLAGPGAAVAGPKTGPDPGNEEASAPLGSPPPREGLPSDGFRFSSTQEDKVQPVTWSPCRPIHYVVRTAHQPPGGLDSLARSFAAVSAATGLVFVDDGPTAERPSAQRSPYQPDLYGDRWAPVLVAWATPDEVPDFGIDVAGEAGPVTVRTPSGDSTFVSGIVYLDPAKLTEIAARSGQAVADSVILHEFGHLVGLAHVNDPNQLMWPRGNALGLVTYQPGDLAGLNQLGQGPCQPDA